MSPQDVVEEFVTAWNAMDIDRALDLLAEDVVYQTVPMEPVQGRAQVEALVRAMPEMDSIRWHIHRMAANDELVMTERQDAFVIRGRTVTVSVAGVFEVRGGAITAWRDYFDLASFHRQMAEATEPSS